MLSRPWLRLRSGPRFRFRLRSRCPRPSPRATGRSPLRPIASEAWQSPRDLIHEGWDCHVALAPRNGGWAATPSRFPVTARSPAPGEEPTKQSCRFRGSGRLPRPCGPRNQGRTETQIEIQAPPRGPTAGAGPARRGTARCALGEGEKGVGARLPRPYRPPTARPLGRPAGRS